MTNTELADLVTKTGRMEWKVSMSREGTFLIISGEKHSITEDQAEILWSAMRGPRR